MKLAPAISILGLLLVAMSSPAWAGTVHVEPVPEPGTMALLATAIGGLAVAKFRRRSK